MIVIDIAAGAAWTGGTPVQQQMTVLDLCCGAGGTSMGLVQAGFDVTGVDTKRRRRYPFKFVHADALEYVAEHGHEYDLMVAGPPCFRYSVQTKMHGPERVESHPDLVADFRAALIATGRPWIIENVEGAPLINPVLLCGSMFGLERLRRHRLFESDLPLAAPGPCRHEIQHDVVSVTGKSGGSSIRDGSARFGSKEVWQELMGIDWMSTREMALAVPPVYSRWLGVQAAALIGLRGAA